MAGKRTADEVRKLLGKRKDDSGRFKPIVGKKYAPENLMRIVKCAAEMPVNSDICMRTGVSQSSLKLFLKKSREGQPEFMLTVDDMRVPFHELFEQAIEAGVEKVERAAFALAYGTQKKVLHHQGRVQYRIDPKLEACGFEGDEALLRDANGKPVPETIPLQDPDMIRFILKARKRDVYGDKATVDHNVRGGVLVVGVQAKDSKELEHRANLMKLEKHVVEFRETEDEDV